MLDWQQRVIDEYDALSEKILKLVDFVFGNKFSELSEIDQCLLRAQLAAMSNYSSILEMRMLLFTEKGETNATRSEVDEESEGSPDD